LVAQLCDHPMRGFAVVVRKIESQFVYLASSPEVAETTGDYFYKCRPIKPSALAQDDRVALKLWQRSTALAGMSK
jgi:retinol dehydrogenase-12